ncbi:unnamed protein product [Coregonus sp. 'balchen']|nr:unnamed protein product [Coregonus sp. 'balchen']
MRVWHAVLCCAVTRTQKKTASVPWPAILFSA